MRSEIKNQDPKPQRQPEIEPAKSPHIDIPQPDAPQPQITVPEQPVPVKS